MVINVYFYKIEFILYESNYSWKWYITRSASNCKCDCDVCLSEDSKDKRLRTSIMVEVDNNTIVIDTGPDFRTQMLNEKVQKLDAVLFTHEHKDHVAGLDDVRAFNYKWKKDIEVYAYKS